MALRRVRSSNPSDEDHLLPLRTCSDTGLPIVARKSRRLRNALLLGALVGVGFVVVSFPDLLFPKPRTYAPTEPGGLWDHEDEAAAFDDGSLIVDTTGAAAASAASGARGSLGPAASLDKNSEAVIGERGPHWVGEQLVDPMDVDPTGPRAAATPQQAQAAADAGLPQAAAATPQQAAQDAATPTQAAATPTQAAATPTQAAATPTQAAATPTQAAATPTQAAATPTQAAATPAAPAPGAEATGLYALSAVDIDGKVQQLSQYAGKITLVVNVASRCGFTESNYKGLQTLYNKYKAHGVEVLAFPSDDFGGQEPGSNEEIKAFCAKNYQTTFPLFSKIHVNGPQTSPVYAYLKKELGITDPPGLEWNFVKIVVDRTGKPVRMMGKEWNQNKAETAVYEVLTAYRKAAAAEAATTAATTAAATTAATTATAA